MNDPAATLPGARPRQLLQLAIAVVAVQLLYWIVFEPFLENYKPGVELVEIIAVEHAQLEAAPADGGLALAKFEPSEFPFTHCCEPSWHAFRLTVKLDEVPPSGLGIIPRVDADNAQVFVGEELASGKGRMALPDPDFTRPRHVFPIAPGLLHEGENQITFVTARGSAPYTDVGGALIAAYEPLQRDAAWRVFLFHEYQWISIAMMALLALLAALVALRAQDGRAAGWMAVLMLAWAVNSGMSFVTRFPFDPFWRTLPYMFATLVNALAWVNFANEWTGRPIKWLRWASVGFAAIAGLATFGLFVSLPTPDNYDDAANLSELASIAMVVAAVARIVVHVIRHRDERTAEAAIFVLLAVLLGLECLGEFVSDTPNGYIDTSFPLIIVAFAAAFLTRNLRLFRSMREFNQLLSLQLADREREIAEGYERRREVERQRALLEERKRIMRDMHDGIGGRLMSLAAQLRADNESDTPEREAVAEELLEALDELRLIVDSLDTAGDDLGIALGAFRARMEPKLAAAGIATTWQIEDDAADLTMSPTDILDIFRILQEASANALRHSGSQSLHIGASLDDGGTLRLIVADTGAGIEADAESTAGHGLANIRRRAKRLGGELALMDNGPGLRLEVTVPPRA